MLRQRVAFAHLSAMASKGTHSCRYSSLIVPILVYGGEFQGDAQLNREPGEGSRLVFGRISHDNEVILCFPSVIHPAGNRDVRWLILERRGPCGGGRPCGPGSKMDSPLEEVARPHCFASPALQHGLHHGHLASVRPQLKGCFAHAPKMTKQGRTRTGAPSRSEGPPAPPGGLKKPTHRS